MGDNRRKNERINIPLEIVLESVSGKRECRISDLSVGGCFVDSIAAVSKGEALTLTLHLPAQKRLGLVGEVAYVYPGVGFGLRFTNLSKEEQIQLDQVIVMHGGKPLPPQNDNALKKETTLETETTPVKEAAGKQESEAVTEGKISGEFERFVQDLLGEIEESPASNKEKRH